MSFRAKLLLLFSSNKLIKMKNAPGVENAIARVPCIAIAVLTEVSASQDYGTKKCDALLRARNAIAVLYLLLKQEDYTSQPKKMRSQFLRARNAIASACPFEFRISSLFNIFPKYRSVKVTVASTVGKVYPPHPKQHRQVNPIQQLNHRDGQTDRLVTCNRKAQFSEIIFCGS